MDQERSISNSRYNIITNFRAGNAIAFLAITSYLIQFFNRVIGSYAPYRIFLTIALLLLLVAKGKVRVSTRCSLTTMWVPMLIVVALHLLLGSFSISSAMDLYTYFIGVIFIAGAGDNSEVFQRTVKIILFFSVFYAVSVWIQLLFSPVYSIYLRLLPPESVSNIQRYRNAYGMLTGFSTNPGFTAGHIITGIVALYSLRNSSIYKKSMVRTIELLLLISALFLTGKRGHLLGVVFACILCYLINSRGKKRFLSVNILLFGTVVLIPMLLLFSDVISSIPALGRISEMFIGLVNGQDVTSGRSRLFAYALLQFHNHPIWGIGWGQYRSSIVGSVTLLTELDTHNIYLQLLCETGIVGFIAVITPMMCFLIRSIRNIGRLNDYGGDFGFIKSIALFSLSYQLFFLVYGISGNPLYDYNYVIMYFISCAMSMVVYRQIIKEGKA